MTSAHHLCYNGAAVLPTRAQFHITGKETTMASDPLSFLLRRLSDELTEMTNALQDIRKSTPVQVIGPKRARILRATQSTLTRKANLLKRLAAEIELEVETKGPQLPAMPPSISRHPPSIGSKWT